MENLNTKTLQALSQQELENRLTSLREEYQKGANLIQKTQSQMLRIEGAVALIQEFLEKPASPKLEN